MRFHREAVAEYLRGALWVLPTAAAGAALLVGSVLSTIQVSPDGELNRLLFQGTADDARQLLINITSTIITVIALVLGLTVVALQLASTQYSPRLLQNFLRDRPNQVVLSIFVATFAYANAGLYTVGGHDETRTPVYPRLAVTVAILLTFASLGALVYFIHRLTRSIQIDTIMTVVMRGTHHIIVHSTAPPPLPVSTTEGSPTWAVALPAARSGYVQTAHSERLVAAALAHDCQLHIVPAVGDYVVAGRPLAWTWRLSSELPTPKVDAVADAVDAAVTIGRQRSLQQDVGFGLRQLVDIALRALSPAVNDPYTAVQALDRLTVLLCELADRPLGEQRHSDAAGVLRVVLPAPTFADHLDLACGQIRRFGAAEPAVIEALVRLLDVVGTAVGDTDRRNAVAYQVRLVLADAERATVQPADLTATRRRAQALLHGLTT